MMPKATRDDKQLDKTYHDEDQLFKHDNYLVVAVPSLVRRIQCTCSLLIRVDSFLVLFLSIVFELLGRFFPSLSLLGPHIFDFLIQPLRAEIAIHFSDGLPNKVKQIGGDADHVYHGECNAESHDAGDVLGRRVQHPLGERK
jgi:hypothetical protein